MKTTIKSIIAIALILTTLFAIVGCGSQTKDPNGEQEDVVKPVDLTTIESVKFAITSNQYKLGMTLEDALKTSEIKHKDDQYKEVMGSGDRANIMLTDGQTDFSVTVINNTKEDLAIGKCVIMKAEFTPRRAISAKDITFFDDSVKLSHNIDEWQTCIGQQTPQTIGQCDDYMWTHDDDNRSLLINIKTAIGGKEVQRVVLIDYIYVRQASK